MRKLFVLVVAFIMVAVVGVTSQSAATADTAGPQFITNQLRSAVSANGIVGYEQVLAHIADQNNEDRASGSPGFNAAAAYVTRTMQSYGFQVRQQPFTFPYYNQLAAPSLTEVTPAATNFTNITTIDYSGTGNITGLLVPTANISVPAEGDTSGCAASDFTPVPPGVKEIALIQRGTCIFDQKVENAEAAGYSAAVIFNSGTDGNTGQLGATLGTIEPIPVIGLDYTDGAALYTATQAGPVTMNVQSTTSEIPNDKTENIIASTKGGDPNHVVMVDAYLDALSSGPGINEDGSGVATMLELANVISRLHLDPRYKIEFVFFGGDQARAFRSADSSEIGLLGSQYFVDQLSPKQLSGIIANIDLDSTGSPNFVRFVFNGDGPVADPSSVAISTLYTSAFSSIGLASELAEPATFDGADFGPLIDAGIPTGGVFGGAAGVKTTQEAQIYGGTAGDDYDACFHQSCDNIDNLNPTALWQFAVATGAVVWTLATQGLHVGS